MLEVIISYKTTTAARTKTQKTSEDTRLSETVITATIVLHYFDGQQLIAEKTSTYD